MAAKKSKSKRAARPPRQRAEAQREVPPAWSYEWVGVDGVPAALVDPLPHFGWRWQAGEPPTVEVPVLDRRGFWVPLLMPDVDGIVQLRSLASRQGLHAEHIALAAGRHYLAGLRDPIRDDREGLASLFGVCQVLLRLGKQTSKKPAHKSVRDLLIGDGKSRRIGAYTRCPEVLLGIEGQPLDAAERALEQLREQAKTIDPRDLAREIAGRRPGGRNEARQSPDAWRGATSSSIASKQPTKKALQMFALMTANPGRDFTMRELLDETGTKTKAGKGYGWPRQLTAATAERPLHGWRIVEFKGTEPNRKVILFRAEKVT